MEMSTKNKEEGFGEVLNDTRDFGHPAYSVREVCLNVFDKLDGKDKPAFSRALTEWHDYLESKRTLFLFQQIALILTDALPKQIFLKTREYCQNWTETWNYVAHSHPSQLQLYFEKQGIVEENVFQLVNSFSSTEEIQAFMEDMSNHPGNPFPGRSLSLQWKPPQRELQREEFISLGTDYWRNIKPMLQMFGSEVHFLSTSPMNSDEVEVAFHYQFRDALLLLPNLKRLDIFGRSVSSMYYSFAVYFYMQFSLAHLPHLETLHMLDVHQPISESLLTSNGESLKRLSLGVIASAPRDRLQHFINLEVLSAYVSVDVLESCSHLRLRELRLKTGPDFKRLFNALGAFSESLTHLKISSWLNTLDPTEATSFRINLPNLKTLELASYDGTLDPFLGLRALTELRIDMFDVKRRQSNKELVQISVFDEIIMESNIWSLMPSLKKLSFSWNKYIFKRNV